MTPPPRVDDDSVCPHHDALSADVAAIRADVREVLRRLGAGDTTLATLDLRVQTVERIVYGGVAIALLTLAGAIVRGVMRA